MTVKLLFELQQQLRRRGELSAYALAADLFGHHTGSSDLATSRKAAAADVWQAKHVAL